MLKVEIHADTATVTGSAAEKVLFWSIWQGCHWQDWYKHDGLGKENDAQTIQTRGVIDQAKEGMPLDLYYKIDGTFDISLKLAVDVCKKVGIEVEAPC